MKVIINKLYQLVFLVKKNNFSLFFVFMVRGWLWELPLLMKLLVQVGWILF